MLRDLRRCSGQPRRLWTFLALTVASSVAQAIAVLLAFGLLQQVFGPRPVDGWPWLAGLVGAIVVAWVLDVVAARVGLELGIAVMATIHRRLPDAVLAWPRADLTSARTSAWRKLASSGANEATSAVVLLFGPVVSCFGFIAALGLGLFWISMPAAIVALAGGLALWGALAVALRTEVAAEERFEQANEQLDERLFEFAHAQPTLRTARRVETGEQFVERAIETARVRALRLLGRQVPGEVLFAVVVQLVLVGFGLVLWFQYDHGTLTGAGAAALVVVLVRVVEQVMGVAGSSAALLAMRRALAQTRELVQTEPVLVETSGRVAPRVAVREVAVRHGDGTQALAGVSHEFEPGTVTVVVGASGSGKSTLLSVLAGLEQPSAGVVELDGQVAEVGRLRGTAAMVFQRTELGSGSIQDSLLSVNPELDDEQLQQIARTSQLEAMVANLPDGWQTPVGEFGAQLSGGERQRVGIARALAKPAGLLLVDEATSALDIDNELGVVEAIGRVREQYTTVLVTHRPAALAIADQVIVLSGGRIVESGSPEELAARKGEYSRILAEWQASRDWQVA